MPPPAIIWLPEMDATLREMRAARKSWDDISKRVGVCRWNCIERAKVIKAYTPVAWAQPRVDPARLAQMLGKTHRKAIEAPVKLRYDPRPIPPARDCQWPLNDPPRGVPWKFCGAPSIAGCSYCAEHKALSVFRADAPAAVE